MDFKQLRSFIAVIRYGSFTTAATRLRISQPTVSTHIRQLEEELGTPLVVRNAKRVELTDSGHKMYDQAVSLLAMHDKMLQKMRRREEEIVYLGASSIPSACVLPGLLSAFCKERPDAKFTITQGSSYSVINGMSSGLYEVGFAGMPANDDSLVSQPFCHDRVVIATPNTKRFQDIDRSDRDAILHMLKEERIAVRKLGSATQALGNSILKQLGTDESQLKVFARLNDLETAKNLVEHGLCIALLSERAVRDHVNRGLMLAFDVPEVDSSRELYVIRRKNAQLSSLAESLFEFTQGWSEENEI